MQVFETAAESLKIKELLDTVQGWVETAKLSVCCVKALSHAAGCRGPGRHVTRVQETEPRHLNIYEVVHLSSASGPNRGFRSGCSCTGRR